MSNSRILATNVFSQVASLVFGKTFGAIASIALIRYLGAEKQGVYSYLVSMVALFSFVTDFGLSSLIIREIKSSGEKSRKLFGNALILQAVQVLVSMALINIYAILLEPNPEIKKSLMLVSVMFIVLYLGNPFIAALNSFEKMFLTSIAVGIASFLNAFFIFLAIYLKMPFNGIIMMLGISNTLFVVLSAVLCTKFAVKPVFEVDYGVILSLMKMCVPFALMGLFNYVYSKIDVLLLFKMKSAITVGYYSAATKIIDILNAFVVIFMGPMYPRLSSLILSGEKESALRVMNTAVKYMVCLVAPFAMMVTILNGDYTRLLLGDKYMDSSIALAILIWSIFLLCIHTIPTYALNAARYTKTVTYIYGINIVVNIGLNLLFIPSFGYIGTSIINLFCNVIVVSYIFYMASKKIGKLELPGNLLRILAAFIPQIIFMLLLKGKMNFIVLSAAGVAVFAVVILLTGYFNPRDLEILKSILIRRKKQAAQ